MLQILNLRTLLLLLSLTCASQLHAQEEKETPAATEKPARHSKKTKRIKLDTLKGGDEFFVIGDWGRKGEKIQVEVANQMETYAAKLNPEFFISTGDNFYENGIADTNDPQLRQTYENVYTGPHLYKPWYVVLGNHDYRGNADAEVAYTQKSTRWVMPARYFYKVVELKSGGRVLFVFTDTTPFEKAYYKEDKYAPKVAGQDTARQKQWLDSVLTHVPADWRIVVGHHPPYSGGMRKGKTDDHIQAFVGLFNKDHVNVVFSGHEHDLQHIHPAGTVDYFVSGAGSEFRPTGMLPYSRFAEATEGFITVSLTKDKMLVQVVDLKGSILYSTTLKK